MAPAAGDVVVERFELREEIARGGVGVVWRAQQLSLDAPCAIKLIETAGASEQVCARFRREARTAAKLRSPHVVRVFEHGQWQGHAFIAMELLEGESLRQRLARVGRLSAEQVVRIAAQLGHALDEAHAVGIVHRDLKPDNIFLALGANGDHVKVLDFGVAKECTVPEPPEGGATVTGALLGTPRYMSPEQLDGLSTLDHRADLWSLAVVIYECLVGEHPFRAAKLSELIAEIVAAPLPPISDSTESASPLEQWWHKAAAREATERYQRADTMLTALADALELPAPAWIGGRDHEQAAPPDIAGAVKRTALAGEGDDDGPSSRRALWRKIAWPAGVALAAIVALGIWPAATDGRGAAADAALPVHATGPEAGMRRDNGVASEAASSLRPESARSDVEPAVRSTASAGVPAAATVATSPAEPPPAQPPLAKTSAFARPLTPAPSESADLPAEPIGDPAPALVEPDHGF